MRLDFDDLGKPILNIEQNGVVIVIAFAETSTKEHLKQTMYELLTAAYEKRIVE